jgi:tight adherence protein C
VIWLIVAVACVFAGGLWLIASAIWPAPPPLSGALSQLHSAARTPAGFVPLDTDDRSLSAQLGRWVMGRVKASTLADERTASDLEVLQRPLELYAGSTVLAMLVGACAGPLLWAVAAALGTSLPFVFPVWFAVVGAAVGLVVPRLVLRGEAARARTDFRHALGAYLDVLVLLLAAQEGPESAMDLAARAGEGPAFAELRRAVWEARLSGDPVWETLDDLGRRLRIGELREIAAAGSLAGESGAAVRNSLTAKARALRQSSLAEAESDARRQSQAMFAPLVLMGIGFVLFLIYPLVTNLSLGGGS